MSHQGGPSGRGLLATVAAVDAVALHQLIGRRVGPEVVRGLHLGVLQGTGSHWGKTREGASSAPPFMLSYASGPLWIGLILKKLMAILLVNYKYKLLLLTTSN